MTLQLEFNTEETLSEHQTEALEWACRALQAAHKSELLPDAEVSLTLVNDEKIKELNKVYRGIEKSTDVLSFPLEDEDMPMFHLGDIVISLPTADRQAVDYGHSLNRELSFLAVHGFLHLLGYTHDDNESEREMFQKQNDILLSLGLEK